MSAFVPSYAKSATDGQFHLSTIKCCQGHQRDVQVQGKYFTWLSAIARDSWKPYTLECTDCGARFQVLNGRARQTRKGKR